MKKLNIVLLVLSLFCCVVGYVDGQTSVDRNYDPRLPNAIGVAPSTWRTVLDVFTQAEVNAAIATDTANWQAADASVTLLIPSTFGTMASETAADYLTELETTAAIATETAERDAHEASNTTDVHGLGTMSGKTSSDYYTTGEVATFAAATSADLTASNVTATTTFLTAIGGAKVAGDATQDFSVATPTLATHALNKGEADLKTYSSLVNRPVLTTTYTIPGSGGNLAAMDLQTPPSGTEIVLVIVTGDSYNGVDNSNDGRYIGVIDIGEGGRVFPILDANHSAGNNQGWIVTWTGTQVSVTNKNGLSYNQSGNVLMINFKGM